MDAKSEIRKEVTANKEKLTLAKETIAKMKEEIQNLSKTEKCS